MSQTAYAEHDVLLLLCDISGYTRFMVSNAEARSPSYEVITELMQAVIREVKAPIEVVKLEGDAAFLYARWPGSEAATGRLALQTLAMLDSLFHMFERKRRELAESNICPCDACKNIGSLSLKVVVHCGRAAIHTIGRFSELSGVDVILVHRLLKNSLAMDRYILLTDDAWRMLQPDETAETTACVQHYEEIGTISARAAQPPLSCQASRTEGPSRRFDSIWWKTYHILKRILISRLMRLRIIPTKTFNNMGI